MDSKYWNDLNKYPPLDRKTEQELARKAKAGDRKAYEKLINSNLRFVVNVAKDYQNQGLELDELIACGNLGLCRAFEKYDPDRGLKFITYAVWWIKQAIIEALNENTHLIKVPHHKLISKKLIEKTREQLEAELQREVSMQEIEEELGKQIPFDLRENFGVISLDKTISDDGKNSLKNIINDLEAIDPEAEIEHESFLEELEDILSDFTEREKAIIKYYHGIGIIRNLTLEEIGVEFGITRERVRQIKAKIIKKLQHKSRKGRLRPYLDVLKSEILYDLSGTKPDPD